MKIRPEDSGLGVLISTPGDDLILDDTEDEEDFLDFIIKTIDKAH